VTNNPESATARKLGSLRHREGMKHHFTLPKRRLGIFAGTMNPVISVATPFDDKVGDGHLGRPPNGVQLVHLHGFFN
jgi:hypothetical protein